MIASSGAAGASPTRQSDGVRASAVWIASPRPLMVMGVAVARGPLAGRSDESTCSWNSKVVIDAGAGSTAFGRKEKGTAAADCAPVSRQLGATHTAAVAFHVPATERALAPAPNRQTGGASESNRERLKSPASVMGVPPLHGPATGSTSETVAAA